MATRSISPPTSGGGGIKRMQRSVSNSSATAPRTNSNNAVRLRLMSALTIVMLSTTYVNYVSHSILFNSWSVIHVDFDYELATMLRETTSKRSGSRNRGRTQAKTQTGADKYAGNQAKAIRRPAQAETTDDAAASDRRATHKGASSAMEQWEEQHVRHVELDTYGNQTTNQRSTAATNRNADVPSHFLPHIPHLPAPENYAAHQLPPSEIDAHINSTLSGTRPTLLGIHAILHRFLMELHTFNHRFAISNREFAQRANKTTIGENATEAEMDQLRDSLIGVYFELAQRHLLPLDRPYRGRTIFPIREDESIFISLAAFRDHLLGATLKDAFRKAEHPERLFIGAVVQNCFGLDYTCQTGEHPVKSGEVDEDGRPITEIFDAPPDPNGIEEFCSDANFKKYCEAGQIRVLYMNETESLGPAVARYYASKLWGGETYYFQADAHLMFAPKFDSLYIAEVKAARSYPKALLSTYPIGFSDKDSHEAFVGGSDPGNKLCRCMFSPFAKDQHIIRVNIALGCTNDDIDGPTQASFIAAGFFFARAEFLRDVPFDPFLPWAFMGEEIALSSRAWTSGWDLYAPRRDLIAHHYRFLGTGIPNFAGSVDRRLGISKGFNERLRGKIVRRVTNMVGYPEHTVDIIKADGDDIVLSELGHYSMGTKRSLEAFVNFTGIDFKAQKCHDTHWCTRCQLA